MRKNFLLRPDMEVLSIVANENVKNRNVDSRYGGAVIEYNGD